MTHARPRFHLAFPVTDLGAARVFYRDVLGCGIGRESDRWIDFDFYGHQITAHLVDDCRDVDVNAVDGDAVPVRHFGAILAWDAWQRLASRPRCSLGTPRATRSSSRLSATTVRYSRATGDRLDDCVQASAAHWAWRTQETMWSLTRPVACRCE